MSEIRKRPNGLFIPKEMIADVEHVEVDASDPHVIIIRSPVCQQKSTALLERICRRRAAIQARRGTLDNSSALIREDRERKDPRALRD